MGKLNNLHDHLGRMINSLGSKIERLSVEIVILRTQSKESERSILDEIDELKNLIGDMEGRIEDFIGD